jgi:hypothetical protein
MVNQGDILFDENTEDIIENGDHKVADATLQNQKVLLLLDKGGLKQFPTVGVGIRTFLNDDGSEDDLRSEITEQFERDGMKIQKLNVGDLSAMEITAEYESN